MIPLLLMVPPIFGFTALSLKTIAGLSMLQAFFASASAAVVHRTNRYLHIPTLFYVGIPMGLSALGGSYLSRYMNDLMILSVFGGLVLIAFFAMLLNLEKKTDNIEPDEYTINKFLSIMLGLLLGFFTGIVGAGGGFVLIPLMKFILKTPFRTAIGTSLGIIFISTFLGSAGKIISLQVDFFLVIPVIIGSLLAAQFGAKVSKITSKIVLKYSLLFIITINLIQIFIRIYTR